MVSSETATASAVLLASHGQVFPHTAGVAVVLASASSALISLPLVYGQTKHKASTVRLTIISSAVVLGGLAAMVLVERFGR